MAKRFSFKHTKRTQNTQTHRPWPGRIDKRRRRVLVLCGCGRSISTTCKEREGRERRKQKQCYMYIRFTMMMDQPKGSFWKTRQSPGRPLTMLISLRLGSSRAVHQQCVFAGHGPQPPPTMPESQMFSDRVAVFVFCRSPQLYPPILTDNRLRLGSSISGPSITNFPAS